MKRKQTKHADIPFSSVKKNNMGSHLDCSFRGIFFSSTRLFLFCDELRLHLVVNLMRRGNGRTTYFHRFSAFSASVWWWLFFLLRPRENIWEESDGCYLSCWLVAYFNNPYPTATFVWNLKSKLCPFFLHSCFINPYIETIFVIILMDTIFPSTCWLVSRIL